MTDNELLLQDRVEKIKQVVEKYGEHNFYMSFSGGKDSTVLSWLIDYAVPDNNIPRVFADTGVELDMIKSFVLQVASRDKRVQIIKPTTPVKQMLEQEGYPFKSKKHARLVGIFQKYKTLDNRPGLQHYLHVSDDGVEWCPQNSCPKKLRYQFAPEYPLKISDRCCLKLKEEPLKKWAKDNSKAYAIIGIMKAEGGRRSGAKCMAFRGERLTAFQPLVPVTKEWEEWLIDTYSIEICDVYKPPYNFYRTGCKGCPFALNLQEELETLGKYFPKERAQCEIIWRPVYEEYRRIGYRLKATRDEK